MPYNIWSSSMTYALAWATKQGGTFSTKGSPVAVKTAAYLTTKGYFEKVKTGTYRLTDKGKKATPENWQVLWQQSE